MCYAPSSPKTCDNNDDFRVVSMREMGEGYHPRNCWAVTFLKNAIWKNYPFQKILK